MKRGDKELISKVGISLLLACLFTMAGCCASNGQAGGQANNESSSAQEVSGGGTTIPKDSVNKLNLALINYTGTSLRAIYISPSDSTGWEENLLGSDRLDDGDTIDIRFDPQERAVSWDLKIEGIGGRYAEWKSIDLRAVSSITLRLKMKDRPVVVAEAE